MLICRGGLIASARWFRSYQQCHRGTKRTPSSLVQKTSVTAGGLLPLRGPDRCVVIRILGYQEQHVVIGLPVGIEMYACTWIMPPAGNISSKITLSCHD